MPTVKSIAFPSDATFQSSFDRYASLLTTKDLKEIYLHGIELKDKTGKELSKKAMNFFIDAAISRIEHQLEITIRPATYVEEHDYRFEEYQEFCLIRLRQKPVLNDPVVEMRLEKDASPYSVIPQAWVRVKHHVGQIQITPTSGSLGEFNMSNLGYMPRVMIFNNAWPHFFRITYQAGFENGKLPFIINHLIGLVAAVDVLCAVGNLPYGNALGGWSRAMDGMSQSITSTQSSNSMAYQARVEAYNKKISEIAADMRRTYGKSVKFAIC